MACKHKFHNELTINHLDYQPETLIVGSFNPQWPDGNTAEWFYGRTAATCFWDVLPRLHNQPSLIESPSTDWRQFCRTHRIALTDLITSIDDADPSRKDHNKIIGGFSDDALVYNFDDFEFTDIVRILRQHPTIRNVYITRSITESFWRHLWSPVMHHCNTHSLHERRLIHPSTQAAYQHEAYNAQNPETAIPHLNDYILYRWQQEWHQ